MIIFRIALRSGLVLPAMDAHFHSVLRAQGDANMRDDGMSVDEFEAEPAQQLLQYDLHFHEREAHADTSSAARAERQVGVACNTGAIGFEKALGIEEIRVLP